MNELERFLTARDLLVAHRTDYETAFARFEWPRLERFNWALDYFDAIAKGNDALALHIVEESGEEARLTYAQLSARSNQVANFLASQGAKSGDRILLMLGNEVPLWETMLAAIKLGAVVIPATTLLSGDDLLDRLQRGGVRQVVTNASGVAKFAELPAEALEGIGRISVSGFDAGEARSGWIDYRESHDAAWEFSRKSPTGVQDPMLEYFTSGTTARPKLVLHTPGELSGRPPVDDVLARPEARRRALEHQLAGLGQARVELLLRALERRGLRVRLQLRALRRPTDAGHAGAPRSDHAVRAADRLAHADPGGPEALAGEAARTDLGAASR